MCDYTFFGNWHRLYLSFQVKVNVIFLVLRLCLGLWKEWMRVREKEWVREDRLYATCIQQKRAQDPDFGLKFHLGGTLVQLLPVGICCKPRTQCAVITCLTDIHMMWLEKCFLFLMETFNSVCIACIRNIHKSTLKHTYSSLNYHNKMNTPMYSLIRTQIKKQNMTSSPEASVLLVFNYFYKENIITIFIRKILLRKSY